jgi:hypothetical protein
MMLSDLSRVCAIHPELFRLHLSFVDRPLTDQAFDVLASKSGQETHLAKHYFHKVEMPQLFTQLALIQFQIWLASGFGNLEIQNERDKRDRIKVCVKACPDYLHYINAEELQVIQKWCEQVQNQLHQKQL